MELITDFVTSSPDLEVLVPSINRMALNVYVRVARPVCLGGQGAPIVFSKSLHACSLDQSAYAGHNNRRLLPAGTACTGFFRTCGPP
jgi:hypothetical protein